MNVRKTGTETFRNEDEGRLRMPWRIVLGLVVVGIASVVVSGLVNSLLSLVGVNPFDPGLEEFTGFDGGLTAFVMGATMLVALWPIGRYVDRRQFADFGLEINCDWWADFGFGLLRGAALPTAIFLSGWTAGWYSVTGTFVAETAFLPSLVILVLFFTAVSIGEELLLRGWLLTNLAEGFRLWGERIAAGLSILGSSLVFGLVHLGNPNVSLFAVAITLLAGVWFGLAYVLTGRLGIPIGGHITWNAFIGSFYGLPVSGVEFGLTFVAVDVAGPDWATGGGYGPEAGVLGAAALMAGILAIGWWAKRQEGQIAIHPDIAAPALRESGRKPATREGG